MVSLKDKRILLIFLTVFIDLVGFGIIIPMNPYLAKEFGASPVQVGWLMSIYSLMQFVFAPFWGKLSDRWGRRPIILISLTASTLSHFGFAFAESYMGLFVFRLLAGVGGGNLPVAMAYIADITDEKSRSKGMGLIGAAFGLGFILGPALGGFFS
ncbi:TCR/Tet family MFS transporter, partial [bacterium]|nr:TCR/Tet family MFS transporter [bacterium]